MNTTQLKSLARLVRYYSLISTTAAGSGHPSSSLSAADLMTALMFGGVFRTDLKSPKSPNNDRLIFSKGHAAPLLYSLYTAAGAIEERELLTLRKFGSRLEGHPMPTFPYTEVATGSLGQGLSVGIGMALHAKLEKLPYRTYVLLGDSEMAEGSVWEAMEIAAYYELDNVVGIIDVNRLGQRGETMLGHDVSTYKKRAEAFGWEAIVVDGHNIAAMLRAFQKAQRIKKRPVMIIAKTIKGKGVPQMENKDGWHGRALSDEQLKQALEALGKIDDTLVGAVAAPKKASLRQARVRAKKTPVYKVGDMVATRKAYGTGLIKTHAAHPNMVVLDAETSNSTFSATFKDAYPKRFFEMFIAEQNMVGTALGFSRRGQIPFVSTFAAFFTRAFDQIRMAQYSDANVKFVGSHAGVSIGEDGPSQMGLEDIALFRSIHDSVILYPSDAVATEKLVEEAAKHKGIVYIRTTRMDTPVRYTQTSRIRIGGSHVHAKSDKDVVTVVAAGVTFEEAMKAHQLLHEQGVAVRIIDLYSIKPLDIKTLTVAAKETEKILTVEDHYEEGGIGEAVRSALSGENVMIESLAVRKLPMSGTPAELLGFEEIDAAAIVQKVLTMIA